MSERPLRALLVPSAQGGSGGMLKANLDRPGRFVLDLTRGYDGALGALARRPYDVVLIDLGTTPTDGIALLRRIRAGDGSMPVFLLVEPPDLFGAADGIRAGATNFIQKPLNVDAVLTLLERAISERPVREEVVRRIRRRAEMPLDERLVGDDPRLEEVRRFARQVARAPGARVLVTGESGTGKGSLARAIHDLSGAHGRFVEVNCAGLPATLLESELFGHEKGAFTDAHDLKRGLAELADGGTLLLDEIGALPLDLQAKLLQFLENQEIRRLGGAASIPISTRVIAATNENLEERVRERGFRVDLLYRLDVASVEMPPLRTMPGVLPELALTFAESLASEMKIPVPDIDDRSFDGLAGYDWPGNARELKNCVERALIFHQEGPLRVTPPSVAARREPDRETGVVLSRGLTLADVERHYLTATLVENHDRPLEEIAARLGISRKTLWEKRRRYSL